MICLAVNIYQQVKKKKIQIIHLCSLLEAEAGRVLWEKMRPKSSKSFTLKVSVCSCHQMLSTDWLSGQFSVFLLKVSDEPVT